MKIFNSLPQHGGLRLAYIEALDSNAWRTSISEPWEEIVLIEKREEVVRNESRQDVFLQSARSGIVILYECLAELGEVSTCGHGVNPPDEHFGTFFFVYDKCQTRR